MEFQTLLLIALLFLLCYLFIQLAGLKQTILNLGRDILSLKNELSRQAGEKATHSFEVEKPVKLADLFNAASNVKVQTPHENQVEPASETPVPAREEKVISIEDPDLPNKEVTEEYIPSIYFRPVESIDTSSPVKESWFENWLKNNPDIEKFIGEDLINKIGIAVLVLGISFFVKYAIDQDWIKEIGRVGIGLLCGAMLIAVAHRLRKNYHSFSSVLVGGGLTVFYFTIALAFHQYQLLSQTTAFICMIVITIFAVMLSILYDRLELAVIATIGGFITPFLVSTGQSNYIVLFSYLSILNVGLIFLAWYKNWRALNFISFVFTGIIYIGWIFNSPAGQQFPYKGGFMFGIFFYALFVLMNVIHHVSRGSQLKAFDFIILLSINLCFYGTGIYLLTAGGMSEFKGLYTASLGFVNLAMGWLFFKQSKADKNFIYLIIGITVTYISLTAPIQLHGHFITLFWAAETVVLLWLHQRSFIQLLKIASAIVTVLMLFSLVMDWQQVYNPIYDSIKGSPELTIMANKGFISGFICSVAMLVLQVMLGREADTYYLPEFTNKSIRNFYLALSIVLLFCTGVFEIYYQYSNRFPTTGLEFIYLQLYVSAFFALLFIILDRRNIKIDYSFRLLLPLLIFILYLCNIRNIYSVEKFLLASGNYKPNILAEWISIVLLMILAYETINYIRKNKDTLQKSLTTITWVISIALIILFSIEIRDLFVWFYYSNAASVEYAENLYSKAGLSIVWGLSSYAIIWLGLTRKYKPLRIIALVFFAVTLIKLFVYDLQNVPPAGKIVAFILLGVVLLIVSFMYQRLKKIIIDETHPVK